ncbi:putative ORfan [Saudi moumouvirus]|nr:putative ORfan [Saudi moumouvirus]
MSYLCYLTTEVISEWQNDCMELYKIIRHKKLNIYAGKDVKNLTKEEYSKIAEEFVKLDEFEQVILNLSAME